MPPRGIASLLSGHTATIKAVNFLPGPDTGERSHLVSGGDDHCIKLWAVDEETACGRCLQTVQKHSAPINCLASARGAERTIVVSGGADATIKIWSFGSGKLSFAQSIRHRPVFFPLTLALGRLDDAGTAFVLAAAGTHDSIQIFVSSSTPDCSSEFKFQAMLAGHEGWIRSLDFCSDGDDLLLASASQDKYIRLWRIHRGGDLPPRAAVAADSAVGSLLPDNRSPSNKAHLIKYGGLDFSITFEALLLGHDDWIYSAKWRPGPGPRLELLSTSADNSVAIWQADPASGIWVTSVRLGELSREKGATTATGSTGGFWNGLWSPSGTLIVTLGRTGSWRWWNCDTAGGQWVQAIAVSGHTAAVTGISWSKKGDYLLSTSLDQTTRLHAEWRTEAGSATWHEMARPQIHGYDLNCISSLGTTQFVSGADEKLIRVFNTPRAVARLLARLTGRAGMAADSAVLPDAANMPVLGLSNKAVEADGDSAGPAAAPQGQGSGDGRESRPSVLDIDHPPFEDILSRHTLWPEVEKLYGHGYEISCLAASHDGTLVASACKASSLNYAVIRLFDTERWVEVKPPLAAHSLTATRMHFSPCDRFLLSVGRDRQWAVFEREPSGDGGRPGAVYTLLQSDPKGHTRMILDCAWAPSLGGEERHVFATAGRDKTVKVWAGTKVVENKLAFELATSQSLEHSVMAVDFLWRPSQDGNLVLVVGTEGGGLSIMFLGASDLAMTSALVLKPE